MAVVLKPKRGTNTPGTDDIVSGEIAIDTAAAKLYINDGGTVKEIGGGGTASGATTEVTQSSHGFSVKDCIRHNGTNWVKAQANSAATLALGVVTEVANSNTFTVAQSGRFELSSHGLTVGQWYYLSADTAGGLVTSEPSFSQPLIYVESANHVFVYPYRPTNVMLSGQTPLGIFVDEFTGNGSTAAYTLSGAPESENNTQVFVNGVYQEKATYSLSGTTLTFDDNIANGSSIEVVRYAATSFVIGVPDDTSVTTAKIATDAVTTAKIADDAITSALIADDAVVQAAIADEAVDEARLQISNAGSNGQFLSKSGNTGGLTWATAGGAYSDWTILTTTPTTLAAKGQYVCNDTTARTHTLPSGSAGDSITICNAGSATVTLARTSSQKINSADEDGTLPQGNSVQLVYVDGTIGWFEI